MKLVLLVDSPCIELPVELLRVQRQIPQQNAPLLLRSSAQGPGTTFNFMGGTAGPDSGSVRLGTVFTFATDLNFF